MSRNRSNVLFIASFAGCPRVWKMASVLAEGGYDVSVLEWDRSSSLSSFEVCNGIRVYRLNLRSSFGLKMAFKLPLWWAYVFSFLLANRFGVVQPQNLDNLVPVWLFSRIKKTKIVYDIADFYASSSVFGGVGLFQKFLVWLERSLVKSVDATLLADESRAAEVGLFGFPFCVVYNSPPDLYDELNAGVGSGSLSSDFMVFYGGILSKDRGLACLVDAVEGLTGVRLVVAGFGSMEKQFLGLVENKQNVQFLGRVSYDKVLQLTCSSDCIVALYDPSCPNNLFASPNKLYEAMMCKKPLIVNTQTTLTKTVEQHQCGLTITYNNTNQLKNAIKQLKNNKPLAVTLGENGRSVYDKKYNWNLMKKRILKLYCSIIPTRHTPFSKTAK